MTEQQHVTRVGILSRVSDDRDATSKSVQQQTELGRRVCREQDWALSERHIYEDANLSASRFTTKDRPVWQRLRRSVRADQLHVRKFAPPFRATAQVSRCSVRSCPGRPRQGQRR